MIEYIPTGFEDINKIRHIDCPSAWHGLETIVLDILNRFQIKREFAIDFGVDHGYSTAIFAGYFDKVWGIDNFKADNQIATREQKLYEYAKNNLIDFPNIILMQLDYQEFIVNYNNAYFKDALRANLIHVDITHDFKSTYDCGLWSARHSDITLFHDTESFPFTVLPAVERIAKETNKEFYNFPQYNGLGIVV